MALQDCRGRMDAPWYSSAKLPFRPTQERLNLNVRGFFLRSWKFKDDEKKKIEEYPKFLVTEITGCGWPSFIPQIGWERFNSGETGASQIKTPGQAPYRKPPEIQPSDPDTVIDGKHDANTGASITHVSSTEFSWLNPPKKVKLKKAVSKQYDELSQIPPGPRGSTVSTGDHNLQINSIAKAEAEVRVRLPEKRFAHILEVFDKLTAQNFLSSARVIQPHLPGQLVRRGDLTCWSFIDEDSRRYGYRPKRGWRIAEYSSENIKDCIYRTALVVALHIDSKIHYWIEIECRKTEGGFSSPLLSDIEGSPNHILAGALEVIAVAKGINMTDALNGALHQYGVNADCYKHWYESPTSSKLDIESVKRFLSGR
jgi:hypothetical protein